MKELYADGVLVIGVGFVSGSAFMLATWCGLLVLGLSLIVLSVSITRRPK